MVTVRIDRGRRTGEQGHSWKVAMADVAGQSGVVTACALALWEWSEWTDC